MKHLRSLLLLILAALPASAQTSSHVPDFMMMMHLAKLQALTTGQGEDMARQIRFAILELRGASSGATIRYSNGQTATSWARREGATWYYPNGQTATSWVHRKDATWYHANGQTLTSWAGKVGATWYHHNGQTATSWAGKPGATWYDSAGRTIVSNGPQLSEEELLDVPRVAVEYLWAEFDDAR